MNAEQAPLPAGIVTFVLTDIEGSTRLLKRLGDRYSDVLERHRGLLRRAWHDHGGIEVSTEGDGCFVAFGDTDEAVVACAQAQRLLRAGDWPEDGVVRVRMGLHCGLAAPHDGNYVAMAIHQCARVKNAAHGGQVLVSDQVARRVGEDVQKALVSVGRYRLPDFEGPVLLYELATENGATEHPGVRALPAEAHNLAPPPTSFVGREAEMESLAARVQPGRVVTLVGPGGVGKTRLAAELGVRTADAWPDGVWAVDLALLETGARIPDAIGDAVGAVGAGRDRMADVLEHLRDRRTLVLLDNAELHVEACARIVPQLLRACAGVGVLATSREPLRIAGEDVVPVGPLAVTAGAADTGLAPAVRLFFDRATAAGATVGTDERAMATIAAICRRLDGLPLAIEIAAARSSVLAPAAILEGLNDMYGLLRSRNRSLPERQRSLEALLDWSYRLLSEDEQSALRRLSVFGGGFSMEAAGIAVADPTLPADAVPELVWSLVERSLLAADLTANATRYRFLETIRQYGRRLAEEAGEIDRVAPAVAAWLLERLGPWGSADRRWLGDVSLELDNLRSLIPLVTGQDQEAAQQLACTVGRYRDLVQAFRIGIEEVARFADELPAATPSRVALLTTLADLHLRVGNVGQARAVLEKAAALRADVGAAPWDDAGVEKTTGDIATRTGDVARAAAIATEALERDLAPLSRSRMWNLLGLARVGLGDMEGALDAFSEELAASLATGHEAWVASAEGNLAEILLRLGDTAAAARHQDASLELAIALGLPATLPYSLIVAARLAGASGEWATAAELQAKATAMLEETGHRLYEDDQQVVERFLEQARAELGGEPFAAAERAGEALDAADAAILARRVLQKAAGASPTVGPA